jgi:DNA-binding CsgD family transcriptional regulator
MLSEDISDREKEVLQLVALGLTNKEIAERLFISSHTVITHRKNITSKLGIKTIAGLTVYAVIHKLISPEALQ